MSLPVPDATSPRVLLVIDDGSTASERGVAHRHWLAIIGALADAGASVDVVTTGDASAFHREAGRSAESAHALRRVSRLDVALPAWRLARLARRIRPDVIHANEAIPALTAGIAGRLGAPGVLLYHRHHLFSSRAHGYVSRLAARMTDRTVGYSEAVARAASRWDGTPPSEILTLQPGVEAPRAVGDREVASLRRRVGIAPGAAVVVSVARLRAEKGIDLLLASLGHLAASSPFEVVIVGDGPEREHLTGGHLAPASVPVHWVGHQDDVAPWYALADVVAVPSRRESLGLTAVEAMAAGRPVVGFSVGGLREVVTHGQDGLLYPPGDVAGLGRGLASLLDDRRRAEELGEAASRAYAERFSLTSMARDWIDAYRRLGVAGAAIGRDCGPYPG